MSHCSHFEALFEHWEISNFNKINVFETFVITCQIIGSQLYVKLIFFFEKIFLFQQDVSWTTVHFFIHYLNIDKLQILTKWCHSNFCCHIWSCRISIVLKSHLKKKRKIDFKQDLSWSSVHIFNQYLHIHKLQTLIE